MSAAALKLFEAIKDTLKETEAVVAKVLAEQADEDTQSCTLTIKEIQVLAQPPLCRKTVQNYLRTLFARGLIVREEKRFDVRTAQMTYIWPACLGQSIRNKLEHARVIKLVAAQRRQMADVKDRTKQQRLRDAEMKHKLWPFFRASAD